MHAAGCGLSPPSPPSESLGLTGQSTGGMATSALGHSNSSLSGVRVVSRVVSSDPPQPVTDEQLLGAHREGEAQAFEQLVERYRIELFRFLIRFCGSRADAEDVFQETFVQVHLAADRFDLTRRFRPWLYTIAANKARDRLRSAKRRRTLSLSAGVDSTSDDSPAFVDLLQGPDHDPAEHMAEQDLALCVQEVVAAMPEHLREILTLAYFSRMAYKEIAETLELPLGTVKSRLHSAVGTFSELWKAQHGNLGAPDGLGRSGDDE